jgi:hypothetical protein
MFKKKLKELIGNLSVLFFSTLISLIVLELGLRALHIPPTLDIPEQCDAYLQVAYDARDYGDKYGIYPANSSHTLCTSEFTVTYNIDSLGYLGYAGGSDKNPRSLLVFGDSFAFGFGVHPSESFAGILGGYNAGLWGNSFPLHALAFKQTIDVIKPREAIWVIYPPHLVSVSKRRWNTLAYFEQEDHPYLSPIVEFYNQTNLSSLILSSTGWGVNRSDIYTREWALYDDEDTSLEKGYQAFEKSVKEITKLAKERNIKLIPLFIPQKTRLSLELDGSRPPLLHFGKVLQGDLPVQRMSAILVKYGVPLENQIDGIEMFKNSDIDWHTQFYALDVHMNADGNKHMAEFLIKKLETIP